MTKLTLAFILFIVLGNFLARCQEEMCTSDSEGKPSCGDSNKTSAESPQDLEVKDDTGTEQVDVEKPKLEIFKPSDSKLMNKTEYLNERGKIFKKPATPSITYPEKAKYEELFLRKGHEHIEYLSTFNKDNNYTGYYDFALDEEEIEYVKKNILVMYPSVKFKKNHQGNFLHFYKTAYEKSLPVMFSVDSMLYALNENLYLVQYSFFENVYILAFKNFLENLVYHCERLKEDSSLESQKIFISQAQIYYGAGLKLLSHKITPFEGPQDTDDFMSGTARLAMKFRSNPFTIMMKSRNLDTKSMNPKGLWRRSTRLSNIFMALQWFTIIKFDLRTDLRAIYLLGKIIVDSGNEQIYSELVKMNKYFNGDDRTTPNPSEIYQLGRSMGINEDTYEISLEQLDLLNRKITYLVESGKEYQCDLSFMNDMFFFSHEQFEKFRNEKEDTSSLFGRSNNLEIWTTNKLIDIKKEGPRLVTSTWEIMDIMHHAGSFRQWVLNRYKGKETFRGEKFMPFRDALDITENFEKAKYSVKRSMEKEPDKWRQNIKNHFHYLLFKLTRKIKHSSDPLFKSHIMKESIFYTQLGAYIHNRRQIRLLTYSVSKDFYIYRKQDPNKPRDKTNEELLIEELIEIDEPKREEPLVNEEDLLIKEREKEIMKNAKFPEVILEPHLEFYREMENLWNNYRNNVGQFIQTCEYFMKINYETISNDIQNIFSKMNYALEILIKGIKLQETGKMDDFTKEEIKNIIKYNVETGKWTGWYVDLHDSNKMFILDLWLLNLGSFPENNQIKFQGSNLFNTQKFPLIAIAVIEDSYEKVKKLVLTPKYNAEEFYTPSDAKADLEKLNDIILEKR
jgi:hypothetical protein